MKANRIEPQVITARQAEQEDKPPKWAATVGDIAFWLSVAMFLKAFADAV